MRDIISRPVPGVATSLNIPSSSVQPGILSVGDVAEWDTGPKCVLQMGKEGRLRGLQP